MHGRISYTPQAKRAIAALWALGLLLILGVVHAHAAPAPAHADVVVVVDTSTSMKQPGMDPERTSLLVAKLLADIVPGELAVVRLLDLMADASWLPGRETGEMGPCSEDPSQKCRRVEPVGNWAEVVRKNAYGALARSTRGDPAFKQALEGHLEQRIHNSLFDLAFRSAQGVFDRRPDFHGPRTIVWLSDGRSDHEDAVRTVTSELRASRIGVTAIVFGKGDVTLPQSMGLPVRRVTSPAELMKAFAGVFRGIVEAPYEWDREIASEPTFDMKAHADEAWIVAYGDASLRDVWLTDPSGRRIDATNGRDAWPSAGAYRVAYVTEPAAGRWTVHVTGGGPRAAYAVVQRSSLGPLLLEPKTAVTDVPTRVVAAVTAGSDGAPLPVTAVPPGLKLELSIDGGAPIVLVDDGTGGDAAPGDGRYSGMAVFPRSGAVPVRVRLHGDIIDRTADATVEVEGSFHYRGDPLHLDLGELREGSRSCRPVTLSAEHTGSVPFVIEALRGLPPEHSVEIVVGSGRLRPAGGILAVGPGDPIELCLVTGARAPSSSAEDEPWVKLGVVGSTAPDQAVTIHLRWKVRGLTFWQRWGWLILLILGVLALIFIIAGYVVPRRFGRALAVAISPEREDLEEQSPQPVAQWKGVGIGFYRHARAYVHANYRLSGSSRGALAVLEADASGTRVSPGRGQALHRETVDGDWEVVPAGGRVGRGSDVFRSGDRGPYFRVTATRRA